MVAGFELCNAYSEQNDPDAAAGRVRGRGAGQGARATPRPATSTYDYVRALEYGMPCTGGLGIGIDRLVMLLSERRQHPRGHPLPDACGPRPAPPGPTGPPRAVGAGGGLGRPHRPRRRRRPAAGPGRRRRASRGRCRHGAGRRTTDRPPARAPARQARPCASSAGSPAVGGVLHAADADPVLPLPAASRSASRSARCGFGSPATCVTMVVGLLLLFLAGQVARGKRRGLADLHRPLRARRRHQHAQGAAPGLGGVLRGDGWSRCSCYRRDFRARSDPPSLLPAAAAGAALHRRRARRSASSASVVERDHIDRRPHVRRRAARRSSRGWSASAARTPTARRFFDEYFPDALLTLGHRRPRRARVPAVPAAARARARTPRTTGTTPAGWCTPTARTRSPTSRCATTRASSSARDGEALIAYTYLGGFALVVGRSDRRAGLDRRRARRVPRLLRGARRGAVAFLAAREAEHAALRRPRACAASTSATRRSSTATTSRLDGAADEERARGRPPGRRARYRFQVIRESEASRLARRRSSTRSASSGGARLPSAASPCR